MDTKEEGVMTILNEGTLYGVVYRDAISKHKVLYKCIPMDEEEIGVLISGKVDKKI